MADAPTAVEYAELLKELRDGVDTVERFVEPDALRARISDLESEMEAPDFWGDQQHAGKVSAEHTRSRRRLEEVEQLRSSLEDIETIIEMSKDAEGAELAELTAEADEIVATLRATLARLQEAALFSGEYDAGDAVVSIHSGEGGVDAQDWAQMLLRMYLRFAEQRGFTVDFNEETEGEEAGIKSASFTVHGENAYGVFNAEAGVHRLVRLSPFDSAHRRQTSFALVEVSPFIDGDVDVEVDDKDLRVDTYRASGAGGQHVNKTDSAIRITHMPTGIVVQCQNERSQHANRDTAMKMLKGKLLELELQKRQDTINAEKGEAQNVGFGSQIRSYVIHPYQMVKDLRTRHETGNVQAVLDGDLDEFIRALLVRKAQGGSLAPGAADDD